VWKVQDHLCPPSAVAAVSLAKRRAIDSARIKSVRLDFPINSYWEIDDIRDNFCKRFVANAQSLTAVQIWQRAYSESFLIEPEDMKSWSKNISTFRFYCRGTSYADATSFQPFLKALAATPFLGALTHLWIDPFQYFKHDTLENSAVLLAKLLPNIQTYGALWYTPDIGASLLQLILNSIVLTFCED
jgi:hypothetical protein